MYQQLIKMNGETCYTLTHRKPATMHVDEQCVTIVYPTGRSLELSRAMISKALTRLQAQGTLTLQEVHEEITNLDGPRTDRLMAVLAKLPGVTPVRKPRTLYYEPV